MSEETKEPLEETPVTAETAETEQEKTPENQEPEKKAKKKEKKEKGITFTREQVEKMELAAKQLESVKDQFTRLTAEYDNYRKRTTKEKDGIYQDAKGDTIKTFLAVYDNLERAAAAEWDRIRCCFPTRTEPFCPMRLQHWIFAKKSC